MTFNFLGPGLTVNVEAKVKEQIILDSSVYFEILQRSDPTKTNVELLSLLIECTQGNLTF